MKRQIPSLLLNKSKYISKYILKVITKIYTHIKYSELKKLEPFTIISNNCIAGFLYQKFNIKYYTPTIGLQFPQEDFLKFCLNFDYYINYKIEESVDNKQDIFKSLGGEKVNFPVGKLNDIIIFFQHYKTFKNAKEKWDERKKRINNKYLFFIFVVYNNTPIEVIKKFESLPIKNKIIITNDDRIKSSISFALHNGSNLWYEKINGKIFSKKYYEQYDFYKWIIKAIKETNKINGFDK